MTEEKEIDLFHNLDVKFNKLSLREHLIVEEATKELQESLEEWQRTCEAKSDTNSQLIKQLADKNEQIEKMKNCRNCKKYMIEGACGHFTQVGWCKDWELAE